MKKITYIISVAAIALSFCSCEKINKSLTEYPIDDINLESYFKTESECQLWLNRLYYNLIQSPVNGAARWGDDCVNTQTFSVVEGTRLVTSANDGEVAWGWESIRRIHQFLEHSKNCEDNAIRLKYEGIARYFRALDYFEKVCRFGDVPWYDHVVSSTDSTDLRRPRDPRGYIMLQIFNDLDFAAANIGEGTDVAHITKWAALALKSRAALFEGTWRIYHANDEFAPKNDPSEFNGEPVNLSAEYFLDIAVKASEEIMESGKYSIYNKGTEPYRDLFKSLNACEEEVILAKLYNNTTSELKNYGHNLPYVYVNRSYGFTKRFVNMYLCKDGTPFTKKDGYDRMWYLDEIKDRDPRLSQTILCPGFKLDDETAFTINDLMSTLTGYKPIKWASNTDSYKQSKSIVDLAIFRYAEVLLNYAEAKAELGQLDQAALDKSVNLIRSRVGMPTLKAEAALDDYMAKCYPNYELSKGQQALVLEVRRERVIELVLEGQHFWDVLRWREGAQMFDNVFPAYAQDKRTGYFGIYFPGFPEGQDYVLYDMDGDGVNDFEIYKTDAKASGKVKTAKSLKEICDGKSIIDPDDPNNANPLKGYITGYADRGYHTKWQEDRDYLWPVPQPQINLTMGALSQNPNWK